MTVCGISPLLAQLRQLPSETEWVEFKANNTEPHQIGEYISALSNSALLCGVENAYIVWGVRDGDHALVGTDFTPKQAKVGNEELENWLATQLQPRIHFDIIEHTEDGLRIVLFKIQRATSTPVRFRGIEYIRSGSYKKKLTEFPEKERKLWSLFREVPFEKGIAVENIDSDLVLDLIDYPAFFDITNQRLPDNRKGILERLRCEKIIVEITPDTFHITNLGALLFAKDLNRFDRIARKAPRVIVYERNDRIDTVREQVGIKGYAIGFEGLISYITNLLPQNEEIKNALRQEVKIYPEIAIRELVANALIHQDFSISGTGPLVEIFSDRIEISNPGKPLIDTLRFIDEPPQSRNESLAAFMRRINVCEERGTGIDKVISNAELYQLPAPEFRLKSQHTIAILYSYKELQGMTKEDKIRACYQHACLKFVANDRMTNASLRERFGIEQHNYSMASRIIAETIADGLIKPADPDNKSKKHARYVPYWG